MGELGFCGSDIPEAVRDEVLRQGFRRVILLGTERDMSDQHLKVPLVKAKVLVLVPGAPDREWLDSVISDELAMGPATPETLNRFTRLLADGAEHGVDAVIITCPELLELYERSDLSLPVVDVMQLASTVRGSEPDEKEPR